MRKICATGHAMKGLVTTEAKFDADRFPQKNWNKSAWLFWGQAVIV